MCQSLPRLNIPGRKIKMFKFFFVTVFLLFSYYCLPAFDQLFQLKLDIQGKYPPQSEWKLVKPDKTFSLKQSSSDSFIKMGVCLQIKNEKIFLLDNNLHKLLVFDMSGRLLRKSGIQGKGPGDLDFPSWFEFYREDIYIANNNGIDIFDFNLKFVRRIRPFVISSRFYIMNGFLYSCVPGVFQGRYPLFLSITMDGSIVKEYNHADFSGSNLKYSRGGSLVSVDEQLIFFPRNKNVFYRFENSGRLIKSQKVGYALLDEVEKWNDRDLKKRQEQAVMVWFCNIFATAKVFKDNIYILLQMPRLEILELDQSGHIRHHYYNDSDFRLMRWYDLAIHEKGGKTFFYVLGFSDDEEKEDQSEFGVFKLDVVTK